MGKDRKYRVKARTRKKKTGVERRRRIKVHKKRLAALGLKEEVLRHMTSKQLRIRLRQLARRPTRKLRD